MENTLRKLQELLQVDDNAIMTQNEDIYVTVKWDRYHKVLNTIEIDKIKDLLPKGVKITLYFEKGNHPMFHYYFEGE